MDTSGTSDIRLHLVKNRQADAIPAPIIRRLVSQLLDELDTSNSNKNYRLVFPVLLVPRGVLQTVCLVAACTDLRLKELFARSAGLQRPSDDATHVAIVLAFTNETRWLKEARDMGRIFPEQPDAPETVL